MKQLIDRIAYSFIGLIILIMLEGIGTLGLAFQFEHYNWIAYSIQLILIFLTVWAANNIYKSDQPRTI